MKLRLKKFIFALSLPLLLASFIPATSLALGNPDQYCSNFVAGSQTSVFTGDHDAYQVFIPTKNTLDAVTVWLKTEIGNAGMVKLEVINATARPALTLVQSFQQISNQGGWVTFNFHGVHLRPGIYLIHVRSMTSNQVSWKATPGICYPRGYAIVDGAPNQNLDFGFGVYTYDTRLTIHQLPNSNVPGTSQPDESNPADPEPAPAGSTPASLPFSFVPSASESTAPAAQTSSAILPPINLTATDTLYDNGGSIDLNWKASASLDIDGYKIFRRAEGDNEYVEILRLPKTFTKFTDPWATKDKTFYYKIRSYKGSQESADSNVAFATSKDDWTPTKNAILDDYKKNGGSGGILGQAGFLLIIPILIVLIIIGLFILGLWALFHKKKTKAPPPTNNPPANPPSTPAK